MVNPQDEIHHQAQRWLTSGEALTAEAKPQVERHLAGCAECQRLAATVRHLEAMLPVAAPVEAQNPRLRQEKMHRLQEHLEMVGSQPQKAGQLHQGVRWAAAILGVILLVASLGWAISNLAPRADPSQPDSAAPITPPTLLPQKPTATRLPQPQPPAIGLDLGYLPLAGFINRQTDRVLRNPVTQEANGERLTIEDGLASPNTTRLWLRYRGELPALELAWLEGVDGQRFALTNYWINFSSGDPNLSMLEFPALPEPGLEATLGLPEGWRLPVVFHSAGEAGLVSASLAPETCLETSEASLCVLAAARQADGLAVLMQQLPQPSGALNLLPVDETNINPFDPYVGCALRLDSGANQAATWLPCQPRVLPGFTAEIPGAQAFTFDGLPANGAQATLEIPVIKYSLPLAANLAFDLGADPQPGQTWEVDLPVQVDGLEVRFTQATLEDDGSGLPGLHLTSQPVQPQNDRIVTSLEIGRPDGIMDHYGYGFDSQTRQHQINIALASPSGQIVNGILNIPVVSAQVSRIGPFSLSWPLAEAAASADPPTPATIAVEGFIQPTAVAPLSMAGFTYTGRPLNSGEVVLVTQDGGLSNLAALRPAAGSAPELVANLPGQVFRVFIHPDRLGLDYLTAENVSDGFLSQARLFTLQLDGSMPVELLDLPPILDLATWSADGSLLFYAARRSQHGETNPALIDLAACRAAPQACRQSVVPFEWQQGTIALGCPSWSTTGTKMAFYGTDENGNGSSSLYVGEFTAAGTLASLSGPLQAENQGSPFAPAWLPDEGGMVYVCEEGLDFNICLQSLDGSPPVTLFNSQSALVPLVVSPDGQWVALPGYIAKGQSMRVQLLDIATRQIYDLPETGWFSSPAMFSPDSRSILVLTDQGALMAYGIDGGSETPLSNQLPAPVQWAGWTP